MINAVSFDYIISNVKSQIAFLKYRTVSRKKGITLSILFFAALWIYQKCHYDLRLPRIVAAFITLLHNWRVLLAHDKHADRWLDCVFTFTRL